jgi:hypothetical protein
MAVCALAAIVLASALVWQPVRVSVPAGSAEVCGPSIVYFGPVDPVGIDRDSADYQIFRECKDAATRQHLKVMVAGFLGFLLGLASIVLFPTRVRARTS